MKKIVMSVVVTICFSALACAAETGGDPLSSKARSMNDEAVSAALDRLSQGGDQARWRSSLGDIEGATATLVAANRKLAAENQDLAAQAQSLESQLADLRQKNKDTATAIAARREAISMPVSVSSEKQKLALLGNDVHKAGNDISAAQARIKAMDNTLALRRLKVQELELEKKTLLMDRDARSVAALGTLKQSIAMLKEQVVSQKGQIDFVSKKISDLKSVDRPSLKEAGRLAAENAKLKTELSLLTGQRGELLKQIDEVVEKKNGSSASPDMAHFQDLTSKKAALEARLAAAQAKKDALTAEANAHLVDVDALAKQIKDLEAENKSLEQQTGNVRENIAVLEYRMNSLTRYKNRNNNKN